MYKFIAQLFSIVFFASGASALELEPSNNSKLSKVCVAAVESTGTLESILRENNVRVSNTNEVLCNNTPITEFARTYKKQDISHTNVNAIFKLNLINMNVVFKINRVQQLRVSLS